MKSEDFYVGWSDEAPRSYAVKGRLFFLIALFGILLVGVLFVLNQQGYKESEYEYGVIQEVSGYLVQSPVWGIRVQEGDQIKTIPIVGFGKMGPGPTLTEMMRTHQLEEGTMVTLRGMLTHYRGKYLMELTEGANSLVVAGTQRMLDRTISMGGNSTLEGEIVDPKCFFGVMNPSTKAVHRSCAIRCIAGGMPPLLAIRENGVFVDYYFIHGEGMEPLTNVILPYVGVPVKLSGTISMYDDWKSITVDPSNLEISLLDRSLDKALALTMCK